MSSIGAGAPRGDDMAFKFKDLIIDVFHAGAAGVHCGPATIDPAAAGVHCGPATIDPAPGGATRATLATLKRQLQEALARIEEHERTVPDASLPSTLAETEDLERRLKAALDELAEHKKKLQG